MQKKKYKKDDAKESNELMENKTKTKIMNKNPKKKK